LRASLRPRTAASPLCVELRERCFTPAVTLGLFVSQALSRAEPCSTVVTKFNRERKRKHLPPVCEDASAYCRARAKLPVELMDRLSHRVVEKTCPHGREQAEF
jgi:hypothetical protein